MSQRLALVCGSRPAVGSSRNSTSGRCTRARAISSRLACPPDRSVDIALRRSARPNTSSSWAARRDASRRLRPKKRLRNSRFSATVSCMSSVLFWVTTPILRFTPTGSATTSRPATQARPPVGKTRVVSMPMVVDLPAPFGPSKSTTIGMLTTLVLPTGGRAWVAGLDVVADPVGVKRRIGVVTQKNTLDMQLTVAENLEFRSRFFGLSLREASRRAAQLLEVFGLADRRKAMSTDLSGGQAKRLLIARALVHRPDVLFLDEPTAGLDPQTRANLWDILRVLHGEGQTILLTTHYMEEAEALCEQVAVIDHGEVLASGTVNQLKDGAGTETVITVRYDEPVPELFVDKSGLADQAGVSKVE